MELKITFVKMSGAGNDFIVIDNRSGMISTEIQQQLARTLCHRRFGIGADGILLLKTSRKADFEMVYLNSDGSFGAMCGNGGRCIARFAYSKGIAGKIMTFEALDHVYQATIEDERVKLSMKDPDRERTNLHFPLGKNKIKAHFIDTGSPHSVVFVDDIKVPHVEDVDIGNLGASIRSHPIFGPEGANVNFVEIIDDNTIKIRTFERGVEGETLACGTGAIASAVLSNHLRGVRIPINVITRGGETLGVWFTQEADKPTGIILEGSADIIYSGTIVVDLSTMKIFGK